MAKVCMPEWDGDDEAFYANEHDCMLGDGGTTIVMTSMTSDGRSRPVTRVHRNPGGGSDVEISLDLWGNGSGHVSHTTNPHLGWNLDVPGWYRPQPVPFDATFFASLDPEGNLGTGLGDAGVSLERGGMVPIPGEEMRVPAPDRAAGSVSYLVDVAATVQREDGFYMDSDNAQPQCQQNVHTVSDGAGNDTMYYQFAGTGDDPVNLLAAAAPAAGASWTDLQTWVRTHNGVGTNTRIRTVRVPDPGADGHFGDDPETAAPADESADDGANVFELPAVVCEMTTGASPGMRYTSAVLSISPTTTYCNRDNNRTALVYILAYNANAADVTPMLDQVDRPGHWSDDLNATAALQVGCPLE